MGCFSFSHCLEGNLLSAVLGFLGHKWYLVHSWRWDSLVAIGHDTAFGGLTHWFPWQSFPVVIKDSCYTCLLHFSLKYDYWLLRARAHTHPPHLCPSSKELGYSSLLPQMVQSSFLHLGKLHVGTYGVWGLIFTLRKLHSCLGCFPWLLLVAGCLGERALGPAQYQELFWVLTNPAACWMIALKPSFYRLGTGSA